MANKKKDNEKPKSKIAIEDADLWKSITGSVRPIGAESKNKIRHSELPDIVEKTTTKPSVAKPHTLLPSKKPEQQRPLRPKGPQLTGIDRRTKQKLLRGNVEVDGRIDLHGCSQIEARARLKNFLFSSRKKGAEFVLVITGKGASPYVRHILHGHENYSAPEREGILRQSLPEWMKDSEFSDLVSGFQPAHPKHGGGGAFYVRLRGRKIK